MDTVSSQQGDILSIDQLALYLNVPKSTLYTLVREGKIPSHKVGRLWRFRKAAIDRWLDEPRTLTAPGGVSR